jgi:hypothetical protein
MMMIKGLRFGVEEVIRGELRLIALDEEEDAR